MFKKFTLNSTYDDSGHNLRPLFIPSISFTSSSVNWKSKMSILETILDFVTDFGMTMTPRLTWYFNRICAGDFLYLSEILTMMGSSVSCGSSFSAHGLVGLPRGEYPVRNIFRSSQKAFKRLWLRYGWHSTWLVTGWIRAGNFATINLSWKISCKNSKV